MTNYAHRPLIDRLGIKPDSRAIILRAPSGYLESLPELDTRAHLLTRLSGSFDFIQYFSSSTEQLEAVLPNLKHHLRSNGQLWLCWAKKSSALHTGLTDNSVRSLGLVVDLVDVKVTSINDDWSALKFVYHA
jgi:hypothetical protein